MKKTKIFGHLLFGTKLLFLTTLKPLTVHSFHSILTRIKNNQKNLPSTFNFWKFEITKPDDFFLKTLVYEWWWNTISAKLVYQNDSPNLRLCGFFFLFSFKEIEISLGQPALYVHNNISQCWSKLSHVWCNPLVHFIK